MEKRDIAFIRKIAKSDVWKVFARPFNYPSLRAIGIPFEKDVCNMADALREAGVDIEELRKIFVGRRGDEYAGLGCLSIHDVKGWSNLAKCLQKKIHVLRQDNEFPGLAYPVAVYYPSGSFRVTALTVPVYRRLWNCLLRTQPKEGDTLEYRPYIGYG